MKFNLTLLLWAIASFSFFVSCGDSKINDFEVQKKEALTHYANLVKASYDDTYQATLTLKLAIDAFVANPTEAGFQACKTAWLNARNPYGQTEAFRFYAGPIDDADGPESLMNAWPIDENFIDYVSGMSNAGLINDPATHPQINKNVLIALHELFSEVSIFTGWHAIEFLLWGQDLSTTGPGNRPFTDYIQGSGGTAANQDRRIQYLQVASNLLMEHLQQMQAEWQPGASFPEDLINGKTTGEALGLLFFGLREFTITEVAGERMFVAIDTKDQEHEHSCFADNTNADLLMNLKGIKNVYFGTYQHTDGTVLSGKSLSDLVLLVDKSKDDAVRAAFLDAETKMNAIPAPFDQAILNNKDLIEAAIAATENLGMRLAEAGKAIGAEF
ncbi:MAG TPA: hypothetical protein DCF33_11650 [Saprospirales bacterium]|nr:hypothetical protein [Saprospirales bacterium]